MKEQKEMRTTRFINKGLTAILFTVLSLNLAFGQEVVDKIVAKVDNHIILKSEIEQAYAGFLSSGEAANFTGDARCYILEQIIETKLMLAMSELDSVDVDAGRVDYELQMRMQNIIAQVGSERAIQEAYGKSVDQLMEELRPNIEEQLKIGAQEENILNTVTVTPAEIRKFFNNIPKDSLPLFNTEFEIGIIIKKPEPNEAEVQKAKDQLMKIRERAMKGENFEVLAIENSQGPTGPNGGNLGMAKRGQFDPAYEAGALALKPGEISMPIVSSFGIHLIQLIEKRGNEFNSRHILITPKPTEQDVQKTSNLLDSLRTLILSDSITFAATAKQYSDDEGTKVNGGFLSGQFGTNRIPSDALDPTMFFIIDEMKEGDISKPEIIDMPDGSKAVQIIYFKSKVGPHRANMTDDYEKLKAATLGMKKAQKRTEYIKEKMKEVYVMVDPEFNRCGITNN
ncbi:peptidylprolyl isomerase [Roseivirga sp.]|uniref:peptidylprolyl isomerase n=1 Tax=Roseivirga sp. TaxID=1964215 RepID=UPI002B273420|nr:peptidylprolyl isomerase [Roseivirga sp.]